MKRILLCLLGLILFTGIFVLQFGTQVSSQSGRIASNAVNYPVSNRPAMNAIANTSRPIKVGAIPRISQKIIRENDARRKIAISVRYPQISGVVSASDFNALSEQLARRHIANFKKDLDPPDADARNRELDISYRAGLIDNRLVSIDFGAGTDWGGAHPGSYSFVLNYDLGQQRELGLYDLFRANSGYMQTISDYCIRRLRNQVSDYESLRDGASPSLENYDSWVITRSGLSITFDAYQVASYAEGPKTVLVPWSAVRGSLLARGPVSHLVK